MTSNNGNGHEIAWMGMHSSGEWDYVCECDYEATGFESREDAEDDHQEHARTNGQ